MRTKLIQGMLVAGVVLAVSSATADLSVYMDYGSYYYQYGSWRGGEFRATPQSGGSKSWADYGHSIGQTFRTFCVESVTFGIPATYIATIDDQIYFGADAGREMLTSATKNVYSYYLDGTLFGLYGDTDALNDAVQGFIWDQQLVLSTGLTHRTALDGYADGDARVNIYDALAASYSSGNTRADSVKVMNLWTGGTYDDGVDKQSQLVMIPAPGAVLLGIIGLGTVAWIRRRNA